MQAALAGEDAVRMRGFASGQGMLVSVAVPVQRFKQVLGAVMLVAGGEQVEASVRELRVDILKLCLGALLVTALASIYLSGTITRPILRLAAATERVRRGQRRIGGAEAFRASLRAMGPGLLPMKHGASRWSPSVAWRASPVGTGHRLFRPTRASCPRRSAAGLLPASTAPPRTPRRHPPPAQVSRSTPRPVRGVGVSGTHGNDIVKRGGRAR